MSRFTDYLASEITPQKTLLCKLNKIIEFLKENEKPYYKHTLSFHSTLFGSVFAIIYSSDNTPITNETLTERIYATGKLVELNSNIEINSAIKRMSWYNNETHLGFVSFKYAGSLQLVGKLLGNDGEIHEQTDTFILVSDGVSEL